MSSRHSKQRKKLPSGANTGVAGQEPEDPSFVLNRRLLLRRRCKNLHDEKTKLEEEEKALDQRIEELENCDGASCAELQLKQQAYEEACEEGRKKEEVLLQLDAEVKRKKAELAESKKKLQETKDERQRLAPVREFMEKMVKVNNFDSMEHLLAYFDNFAHVKDGISQRIADNMSKQAELRLKIDQEQKQHDIRMLEKKRQLDDTNMKVMELRSEVMRLRKKKEQIIHTTDDELTNVTDLKMSVFNLHLKTGKVADINDTKKQLEDIAQFVSEKKEILRLWQQEKEKKIKKSKEASSPTRTRRA